MLCLLSYAAIAHTPGLRIRFVRFRQTVWAMEVIDTIARQYSGGAPLPSNFSRNCTPNRELRIANREPRTARVVLTSLLSYARIHGV